MTKKDYELIARALASVFTDDRLDLTTYVIIVHAITDALSGNNPNFDRARFLKACVVEERGENKLE